MKDPRDTAPELKLYRRHLKACPHRARGREFLNCSCPIWVDGFMNGRRFGQSLKTHDLQRAIKRKAWLESEAPHLKPITEAIAEWHDSLEVADSSLRRYKRITRRLEEFCTRQRLDTLADFDAAAVRSFRQSRKLARTTSARELTVLRQFFGYCVSNGWMADNVGLTVKMPPDAKPGEKRPYTPEEMAALLAACDRVGQTSYERTRARAMILLMRHTGLRISDVMLLAKSRVRDAQVMLYTRKTGEHVLLPIPAELEHALVILPCPRRADGVDRDSGYFFWNGLPGKSGTRSLMNDAGRLMRSVARIAGVPGAHPHRFRHTLATDILARGGTIQDVADVLGISAKIAEKHYAKWNRARQERIFAIMHQVQAPLKEAAPTPGRLM